MVSHFAAFQMVKFPYTEKQNEVHVKDEDVCYKVNKICRDYN